MGWKKREEAAPTLGYDSGFSQSYQLERELGRGGNGVVRLATQIATGAMPASSVQCSHPPLPFPPALLLVTSTNPNDETQSRSQTPDRAQVCCEDNP